MENKAIQFLASKYSKTPAQILLRHQIQKGISVIPKSKTPSRIMENINIFNFELNDDEVEVLNNQPQTKRFFQLNFMAGHPEDPWKEERVQEHDQDDYVLKMKLIKAQN